MGPGFGSPSRPAWWARAAAICASSASRAVASPSACSTPSIQDETAILLIGGDKTGDSRFYKRFVPLADRLYDEHLRELKEEGLIE